MRGWWHAFVVRHPLFVTAMLVADTAPTLASYSHLARMSLMSAMFGLALHMRSITY